MKTGTHTEGVRWAQYDEVAPAASWPKTSVYLLRTARGRGWLVSVRGLCRAVSGCESVLEEEESCSCWLVMHLVRHLYSHPWGKLCIRLSFTWARLATPIGLRFSLQHGCAYVNCAHLLQDFTLSGFLYFLQYWLLVWNRTQMLVWNTNS